MSNKIFAFQSWGSCPLQLSSLYQGQEAIDFIESHYNSGTFASLHEGGEEVAELYEKIQKENEEVLHKEMWG